MHKTQTHRALHFACAAEVWPRHWFLTRATHLDLELVDARDGHGVRLRGGGVKDRLMDQYECRQLKLFFV
jgi:hypothetical protein